MLFTDLEYMTAAIGSGASLSAAVALGKKSLVAIVMDTGWTAAGLSFQASPDGVSFDEVFYLSGLASTEFVITSPGAGQFIQLDPAQWRGIDLLKVRSGTSGAPVAQAAARSLTLVVRGIT